MMLFQINKKISLEFIELASTWCIFFFFSIQKPPPHILDTCTRQFRNKTMNALIINREKSALL